MRWKGNLILLKRVRKNNSGDGLFAFVTCLPLWGRHFFKDPPIHLQNASQGHRGLAHLAVYRFFANLRIVKEALVWYSVYMNKIMPNRMDRGFFKFQEEYEEAALRVLRSGWYVLGQEVENFEKEFARYTGSRYCVGLASGLDALWIAFRILGIGAGDEVIVQGNTYIASVMGITINGATPVFAEPRDSYQIHVCEIEKKITKSTKAVLVVHLYGQPAEMGEITRLCKEKGLILIEDCAQSHGAKFQGKMTGTFGSMGCFSFYPSKNLGAFGDAGAIVTDDKELADKVRVFRNYGSEKRYHNKVVGANSRLDELQAALLRVKLSHIEELTAERQALAKRYLERINNPLLISPKILNDTEPVWHQFVVRCKKREELISYLDNLGIGTLIHYPIPPHLSEAYGYLGLREGELPVTEEYAKEVLSIPMYNGMTLEEQEEVINALNAFQAITE